MINSVALAVCTLDRLGKESTDITSASSGRAHPHLQYPLVTPSQSQRVAQPDPENPTISVVAILISTYNIELKAAGVTNRDCTLV